MITLDNLFFCVCVNRNLRKTESKKDKLENQLNSVGAKVNELKEKYITIQWFHLLFLVFTLPFVLYSIFMENLFYCFHPGPLQKTIEPH